MLTEETLKKLETTTAWNTFVMQSVIHTRNLFGTSDKDKMATEISALSQYELKTEEYLGTLRGGSRSEDEKSLIEAAAVARDGYVAMTHRYLAQLADGKYDDAKHAAVDGSKPAQQAYLGKLVKLSGFYKTEMTSEARALAALYDRTRTRMALLTLAAILVATILAVLITRSIHNPLKHAVDVIAEVERGNYDTRVDVGSKTEMGLVLAAVQKMQFRLKARTEADSAQNELERARADTERQAAVANARIQTALDRAAVGIMLADMTGIIIYTNDCA
jgi:methyl-accepting chemotaxis protein